MKILMPVAFLAASLAGPALAGGHSEATRDVVMSHLRAVGALDLDAMVADYAEDATLLTASRVYSGTDEIRAFHQAYIDEFSQSGIATETEMMVFEGGTGLLVWSGESPENVYEYAADTFVVEDGKIVSHTFAAKVRAK